MKNVVDNDRSTRVILHDGSSTNFRRIIDRGICSVVRSIVISPRLVNFIFHLGQAGWLVPRNFRERMRDERGLNPQCSSREN